jgi:inorganic phosphate transporter, PiT family
MSGALLLVAFIIAVALAFDYINGFHDAANSIATVVSTRVLTPMQAVAWAAFFNFVAAFGFGVQVAKTVGKGVVEAGVVDQWVILGALTGAIMWNLITWYFGIPSSSSHALIGGFSGAAVAKAGWGALVATGLIKITVFIVLAPILGMALGFLVMVATLWTFRSARPILAAHAAIGLGTMAGGWRIVKTMGMRLTKLRPVGGFCAETAGAVMLMGTAVGGIPVSTTHTITGSIMGVGVTQRLSAVRWGVAGRIVWAWVLTIPLSAVLAAATWLVLPHG